MPKIIKSVDLYEDCTFHAFEGNTSINVSGGADSALLLYFTLLYTPDTVHIMTLGNNNRYRRNVSVAASVVEKCIQLTGNSNLVHHIHYTQTQTGEEIHKMSRYYKSHNLVDVAMGAITRNPPRDITDTFFSETTEADRDPDLDKIDPIIKHGDKIVAHIPFVNIDKRVIAELYREHDLMESLFPYTRSCEFDPERPIGMVVDPGLGHCGKCWWCEERKWAFGRLK